MFNTAKISQRRKYPTKAIRRCTFHDNVRASPLISSSSDDEKRIISITQLPMTFEKQLGGCDSYAAMPCHAVTRGKQ